MKTFALAGNPNCGKTTLFNALTGATAHVGNWPGVTVDKLEGVYKKGDTKANIVDLPGIYSLSPYTPEEVISRNYILDEKPDAVINVIDATNLERNLYLTTQLLEMDVPVIIALNMMDEVEKEGDKINANALESAIGVPVVPVSALTGKGIKELMDRAVAMSSQRKGFSVIASAVGEKITKAENFYKQEGVSSPLFHAVKLLESDELELERRGAKELLSQLLENGEDLEAIIADQRYKYIAKNFTVVKEKSKKEVLTKSDKADKVLTHKIWGIPIFLVVLFAVFHLTFSEDFLFLGAIFKLPSLEELGLLTAEGDPLNVGVMFLSCIYDGAVFSPGVMLTNLLALGLDGISGAIVGAMESAEVAGWAVSLVGDGILGGLFAVLGFLPQILTLFLFFSILEDSGYMARVAFILDRIFRRFGLSGRAFMPMIMGFGCSLPGMINTRTLSDENERTATIRVIPFFSCGAKLPILTAIAGGIVQYFGVGNADVITYSMYLIGIVTAIVSVIVMRGTTMKGEVAPFIMELPSYRMPKFSALMLHLWDKLKHFVKKAFTIIFASTVIIWLLSNLTWSWQFIDGEAVNRFGAVLTMEDSILASIGQFIQPLFTPLGFGSQLSEWGWVFAVAAITGLVAKENVIATFGTLAACIVAGGFEGTEEGILEAVIMIEATGISIPALISFIVFNMTTIPCFAACATAKAELPKGKFKWTLLFWLVTSYTVSSIVYTVGSWWWTAFIWVAAAAAVAVLIVLNNKGKINIFKRKES